MRNYTNILIGALLAFALVAPSYASVTATTGTCTVSVENLRAGARCATFTWTSSSLGNMTATTTDIVGEIRRCVINPGAAAPTAAYDMTVIDRDGIDVLGGQGANLSATVTTETVCMVTDGTTPLPIVTLGTHTISITNAGDTKGGVIRFYLRY